MLKDLLIGGLLFGAGLLVGLWWAWPPVEEPDLSAFQFWEDTSSQTYPCSIAFGSFSAEAEVFGTEREDWLCPNRSPVPKTYETLRCYADTAGVGVDIKYGETWISNYQCGVREWVTTHLASPIRVESDTGLTVQIHGYGVARYVHLTLVPSEAAQEEQHAP